MRVVETPGHTVGSISFWHEPSKTIIVGDAMQTKGQVAVSGDLVIRFPFPAFATGNKHASLTSVKKIYELSPENLAVGHGRMIEKPMKKIEQAIKRFENKLS